MIINHNISALNTYRQLSVNNTQTSKSLEKLSSGLRINRAGDDAAGLAISEKMRAQIRGLDQAQRNAQDGISLIQTAEGALNETQSILQRMRELAVQSSSDTNTDSDRAELQKEINQLVEEIDRISNTTEFNSKKLLNGDLSGISSQTATVGFDERTNTTLFSAVTFATGAGSTIDNTYNFKITASNSTGDYTVSWADSAGNTNTATVASGATTFVVGSAASGVEITLGAALTTDDIGEQATVTTRQASSDTTDTSLTYQIGANSSQVMNVSIEQMDATSLFVDNISVETSQKAEAAITAIGKAIDVVSGERAKLGAFQNRLEHTINNLGTSSENLSAAESRIRDVDMAKEMMNFTKNTILNQAAQAMLAQANQQPQGVLQLLR